ncbi:MAG: GAF domain-containing protein [Sphingobacteriales bacterium]|nr:MAG: GAF domain-containing protein [Sphingobacteriales bacterium]
MIIAALPADEYLRLQDLRSYDILDSAAESDFDELVELAGQICNTPISLITLLDENRQWFKAKKGMEDSSTSRDVAFCAHAILQNDVMVVEDTTRDERFENNPFVTGEDHVRFYAGAPIVSPAGHKLGTICIIDKVPKKLSPKEERALTLISKQITKLLELRKKNMIIRQRAEEIINLKTKTISTVMQAQEADKKNIAFTLHEDLAQRLASSMIFLDIAQHNEAERMNMIETAKREIKTVMIGMRNLTYAITPYTSTWIPADELVAEFIEKTSASYNFEIDVTIEKSNTQATQENALTSIRVLEQWFKILAEKKQVTQVNINISTSSMFEIYVEDDGEANHSEHIREQIRDSMIYDRVHSQEGTIEIISAAPHSNSLEIKLPVLV